MESSELKALIEALKSQTEAINRLAQSNTMLVQAMIESDGDDQPVFAAPYLDGQPNG